MAIKRLQPKTILSLLSWWPPFLASGITVREVNPTVTRVRVQLRNSLWNRNYVGTHFGGSLYSMSDPFYMFILLHHLGKDHIVWDRAAEIDFLTATSRPVEAVFEISESEIDAIRKQALTEFKVEPVFRTEIRDPDGKTVASVSKRLYVRRKDRKPLKRNSP